MCSSPSLVAPGRTCGPAATRGTASGTRARARRCRARPPRSSAPVTRKSCGIDEPGREQRRSRAPADATMNSAFRMLLAAMIRERCDGLASAPGSARRAARCRSRRTAPISTRSAATRQCAGLGEERRRARRAESRAGPRLASHRSSANSVRPIEPNGTRPSSTLRPDSRSHSSEPTPMPTENSASRNVTTCSSPPRTSLARSRRTARGTIAP